MCPSVFRLCGSSILLYYYQCKFKWTFNMLTLEDRINVKELLSGIDSDDLVSLASTVTKGLVQPTSREEALEAVLQHSESVESVLNRQKVTRDLIFSYLHHKKVNTNNNLDKKSLSTMLLEYWREQLQTLTTNGEKNETVQTLVPLTLDPQQVDDLAHQFTDWFYKLINRDFLEGGNFALGPEHFWNNACLHLQLYANGGVVREEEASGSASVVSVLSEVKQQHKLYFSPNNTAEGVRGRAEPHGMVCVLVCGTLHQSVGVAVGVFEQCFYLTRDPLSNNAWKVTRTQLVMRSTADVSALPTLAEGQLTRSLLPIENPD